MIKRRLHHVLIVAAACHAAVFSAIIVPALASDFPGTGSSSAWGDALPYYNLANKMLNEQRFGEAAEKYQEAIRRYPYDPDFYINLGVCYQKLEDFLDAEAAFRKATELRKNDWSAWMNLGNAYLKQNRLKETLKAFEQALKCNPPAADRTFLVNDINDIHRVMRNLGQEPMPDAGAGKSKKTTAKTAAAAPKTARVQAPKAPAKPQKDWGYE